jgi:hypothetical protein
MSSRASQKSGVAKPTEDEHGRDLVEVEYCRVADSTPIGTARRQDDQHLDDVQQ